MNIFLTVFNFWNFFTVLGIILIILGFLLTPFIIGIPIMTFGFLIGSFGIGYGVYKTVIKFIPGGEEKILKFKKYIIDSYKPYFRKTKIKN